PMSEASCRMLRDILEIPHAGAIADAVPGNIVVGQKTGSITGVSVNWGYVDLPGRPYVVAVMGNYGETSRITQTIRAVADATHDYFSVLAGVTPYGTRVR
ncbi:MAG: serine hydrolase, partial [Longimicrobiales bacterium]